MLSTNFCQSLPHANYLFQWGLKIDLKNPIGENVLPDRQEYNTQEKGLEEEEIRLDERTKILRELQDMLKEAKKTKKQS